MKKNILSFLFLSFLLTCFSSSYCQSYKFKTYSIENGLPQPFIYTIDQDKKGFIWIGTGDGIAKFDGFRFTTFQVQDSLSENFITTSFTDRNGNLWFGHNQGGLSFYNHHGFTSVDTKGLTSAVTDIKEDKQGNIWFSTQNSGLIKYNGKNFTHSHYKKEFSEWLVHAISFTENNELLLGTNEGLFLFNVSGNRPELIKQIEEIPATKIQHISRKKDSRHFWVATEDAGFYQLIPHLQQKESFTAMPMGHDLGLASENVQHVLEDKEHNLWISTYGNGVHKMIFSGNADHYNELLTFNKTNGLQSNFVKTVFQDHEGNIWIGTYGGGLSLSGDDYFVFYPVMTDGNSNVLSVFADGNEKWMGMEGFIVKTEKFSEQHYTIYGSKEGLPDDKITAIYRDISGTVWAGTEKSGLYKMTKNRFTKVPLSQDKLSSWISGITAAGTTLWIATKEGAFAMDTETGSLKKYSTENGLRHNNINDIHVDEAGGVWIATHSNDITVIKGNDLTTYHVSGSDEVLDIISITQDKKKNTWLATYGAGIFQFTGSGFKHFSVSNGLKSNYCYSIISDKHNNIWIGHRGGVSKYEPEANNFKTYGVAEGVTADFNFNAVCSDSKDNIWFGTTHGAIKYDPARDIKNAIPPNMNILSFYASDERREHSAGIDLDYEIYKLKFEFIGLSYKNPDEVTYRYKLEGYDLDWSEPTKNGSALYTRVEDGDYIFKVRACNSDGICSEPAELSIAIASPVWKQWWFVVLLILSLTYAVYAIIQIKEKEHRRIKTYLQTTLDERTHEVIKQKEELEKKNKDITDSINYAKRIQEAILPNLGRLKQYFPESFIFYQPKDIVSGDFYWFKQTGNKFIIACADATGHGVPGAFMSLIGSTLLKDITEMKEVQSPADILTVLDQEVKNVLKQHGTGEDPKDGMDMSVCEFDLETKVLRVASAMRPVFLYHDREWKFIKGDRISIGGGYDNAKKEFTIHTCTLSQGDIVYMFTDGYTDQFGGEENKKIKLSGLENLLKKNYDQPMLQQQVVLKSNFNTWRRNNEQIDDVLLLGIKV